MINRDFIKHWSKVYDENPEMGKYEDYEKIVEEVKQEFHQRKTLGYKMLLKIVDWKAPRAKGYLTDPPHKYEDKVKEALQAPDEEKLRILDELKGIGVPIASTILHFVYPDKFPIMDYRAVEALRHFDYRLARARSQANYTRLREIELEISNRTGCSLREIDKALFAYHKRELEQECRK